MKNNSATQRRRFLLPIVVRAVWYCLLLFCVGGILVCAAAISFPRAGASAPFKGAAAFQENCGMIIGRLAHYPFDWFYHIVVVRGAEILVWVFWAAICYLPFALLRWPHWVFRLPPPNHEDRKALSMNPQILYLALVLSGGLFGFLVVAECQTHSSPPWNTFTDTNRHFHFEYPPSWKISTQQFPVTHYRNVFVSLNNFGADRFALREQEVATNRWEFGLRTITNQLPGGAIYLDIGWWEHLGPRFGPGIHEMEAADLSPLLKMAKAEKTDGLVTRRIEFHKWGRRWSIMGYLRTPVSQEDRQTVEKILESFHFDGVPAGEPVWAIGEARKHLPQDADPDQFTREGGSSVYYITTSRDGNDVLVSFTKHKKGQPKETWSFRVTETGTVIRIDSQSASPPTKP